MLKKIIDFYRALPPAERPVSLTDEEAVKLTKKLRLQSFFAGTCLPYGIKRGKDTYRRKWNVE